MAFKETKRKGFNFFRSYYDVYNELESDKDKLAFIEALLDRQFLGIKPTNLTGMAKFAYISQTNSIDSQVKGYEDKTGINLTPTQGGRQGGSDGGSDTPAEQVEVKEKEKEKYNGKHLFKNSDFYNKNFYLLEISKTDFGVKNIDFGAYWYAMEDYSEQHGKMYKNWLSTAKSWIRRDIANKTVKIKAQPRKDYLEW